MNPNLINSSPPNSSTNSLMVAATPRTSKTTKHAALIDKTEQNMHKLLSPLSNKNWLQGVVDVVQHQPNLSKIVAIFDLILPRSMNQEVNLLGFHLKGHHQFEGYHPTAIKMAVSPQGDLYRHLEAKNPQGVFGTIYQRLSGKQPTSLQAAKPTLKLPIDQTMESKGVVNYAERQQVIQKLVCVLLDTEQKSKILIKNNNHIDIDPEVASNLILKLLPQAQKYLSLDWLNQLEWVLAPQENDADCANGACLSDSQIKRILTLHPSLIELVTVLDRLTYPSRGGHVQTEEIFPVFEQEDFIMKVGEVLGEEKIYLPTFLNQLSRSALIDQPYYMFDDESQTQQPLYVFNLPDGKKQGFDNKGLLIGFLANQASQQLFFSEPLPACGHDDLLPLHALQLVSTLNQTPVPNWIIAHQNSMHTAKQELRAEQIAKKKMLETQRQQQTIQQEQQKIQGQIRNLNMGIPQQFVADNLMASIIHNGSNHDQIEKTTTDTQFQLNDDQVATVNTILETQFTHFDMAHNSRGKKAIRPTGTHNKSVAFIKDNECWNRATWLSVFEQVETGDELAARIAKAKVRVQSQRMQLVAKTLVDGYLLSDQLENFSKLHFLHYGEEDKLSTTPAQFRTGQTLTEFCKAFGLDDIVSSSSNLFSKNPELSAPEIESELKRLVFALAAGVYETVRELKSLKYGMPGSMATSDIPIAVHRALGLPCLIIENNRQQQQMTLRLAGPKEHPLQQLLQNAPKDANGLPLIENEAIEQLLTLANIPLIYLSANQYNDGHFTVYLPNQSPLANQILFANATESALTDEKMPSRFQIAGTFENKPHDVQIKPIETKAPAHSEDATVDYQAIQFPGSNNSHWLATRESDRQNPLSVIKKAFEVSEKPIIFDFVSPEALKDENLPALSVLLSKKKEEDIKLVRVNHASYSEIHRKNRGVKFSLNLDKKSKNDFAKVYQVEVPVSLLGEGFNERKHKKLILIEFVWPSNAPFDKVDRKKRLEAASLKLAHYTEKGHVPIIRANSEEKPQTAVSLLNAYRQNPSQLSFNDFYASLFVEHVAESSSVINVLSNERSSALFDMCLEILKTVN